MTSGVRHYFRVDCALPQPGEAGLNHSNKSSPLDVLREDISLYGSALSETDWQEIADQCREVTIKKRDEVFTDQTKRKNMLFITQGVCAGQLTLPQGQVVISRFFEERDLCAVVEFAHLGEPTENVIIAVTPVEGVMIPKKLWKFEHFEGQLLGLYTRLKMYRQHLSEIDIMHVKTVNRTEVSYEFLKERHPAVLDVAPQTVIAQFCGITPEGYSRFLRNYTGR